MGKSKADKLAVQQNGDSGNVGAGADADELLAGAIEDEGLTEEGLRAALGEFVVPDVSDPKEHPHPSLLDLDQVEAALAALPADPNAPAAGLNEIWLELTQLQRDEHKRMTELITLARRARDNAIDACGLVKGRINALKERKAALEAKAAEEAAKQEAFRKRAAETKTGKKTKK